MDPIAHTLFHFFLVGLQVNTLTSDFAIGLGVYTLYEVLNHEGRRLDVCCTNRSRKDDI
jgi:hypothetical protein